MRPQPMNRCAVHTLQLVTCRYLRYVLIRSLAYTNDQTLAGRIAVYTLITSCLLFGRLRRRSDLGIVIDTMVEMIGEDQVISDTGQVTSGELKTEDSILNTADARLCEVAGAINGLDRTERQLLVLHHIEELDIGVLADMHQTTAGRIEKTLAKAERQFVEILRGMSSWNHEIEPDVHSLLADFAACLDADWAKVVADSALHYLVGHRRQF